MKARVLIGSLACAGLALSVGQMTAIAVPGEGGSSNLMAGPDVIVGDIPTTISRYGSGTLGGVTFMSYAVGSTSCNIGTSQLGWYQSTSNHPVIPQNAYRIRNGRIEQIGMSWMKYGFCALQQTLCGTCQSAGGGCPSLLGIGCSDPYTSSLNGTQTDLGPRSRVNASTGVFPADTNAEMATWPAYNTSDQLARRLLIKADDLNPSLNSGAVYLAECQYVHPEDAQNNNDDNNASYRTFTVGTTISSGTYPWTMTGTTQRQKPAITHMATVYPTTAVVNNADGPDGRFVVATNVINNNNGTYRFEYAVFNLNSDASGASFSVPVPAGVTITGAGFKDIAYHSGESYDGTDWAFSNSGGVARWQCTQTFAQNPNANALRFSTLYNFWFDATAPGVNGNATIGLFKQAGTVTAAVRVPSAPCAQGDLNCNGSVDGADLGVLLANWGGSGASDLDGSGSVDGGDLGILLSRWGSSI